MSTSSWSTGGLPLFRHICSIAQSLTWKIKEENTVYRGMNPNQKKQNNEVKNMDWIKMRRCVKFVPKDNLTESEVKESRKTKCCCGYKLSEHQDDVEIVTGKQWSIEDNTETCPTNAYGEIEFVGYDSTGRKYVRLDCNTPIQDLRTLFSKTFQLEKPSMLISITGGARNYRMDKKLKSAFRRGLLNIVKSSNAWVTTGGTFNGVIKDVGKVMRNNEISCHTGNSIVAIGVVPWGSVQNRDSLINFMEKRESMPATYKIGVQQERLESFLDPHHTHFLLVDDGTQHEFGHEIAFRAKFEAELSNIHTTDDESLCIPVVQLAVEGGFGTLRTVYESLKNSIPVVVIKGTGRIADVIAYMIENGKPDHKNLSGSSVYRYSKDLKEKVQVMLKEFLPEKRIAQSQEMLEECLHKQDLVTIYEVDANFSDSQLHGIDVPLLHALIKSKNYSPSDKLRLALYWDRIDVAKTEIFVDNKPLIPVEDMNEIFVYALKDGKTNFVELLMENGVCVKEFLTTNTHLRLYSTEIIGRKSWLFRLLSIVKKKTKTDKFPITLKDVRNVLKHLIDIGIIDKADTKPGKRYNAGLDLFVWSLLMNHLELAKLFWSKGKNPIAMALIGSSILEALAQRTYDTEHKQHLFQYSQEFGNLAIGVLGDCYEDNEEKSFKILIREITTFENMTLLELAFDNWNRKFIAQKGVQILLNAVWYGRISYDNSTWKMVISPFLLGLFILRYKGETLLQTEVPLTADQELSLEENHEVIPLFDKSKSKYQTDPVVSTVKHQSCGHRLFRKLKDFFLAPVMIFAHHLISYLMFLLLYSYMILVDFSPHMSIVEMALLIYVFSLLSEEIRQLIGSRRRQRKHGKDPSCAHSIRRIPKTLRYYISSQWNQVDVLTIILFLSAVILRFIPQKETIEAARIMYGISLLAFFFRMLRVFAVNHELGPKLVMIQRMMIDLTYFIIILFVFITSYAICAYAILKPNSVFDGELIVQVLRLGYWNIYGELFLDEIEVSPPDCSNDPLEYNNGTVPRCPERHRQIVTLFLMAFYILISNVLLLNILIAMFGNTFQKVHEKTNLYWYYQRFSLVKEFYNKPFLPPPLNFFMYLFVFSRWVFYTACGKCCHMKRKTDTALNCSFDSDIERKLKTWECLIADIYYYNLKTEKQKTQQNQLDSLNERIDVLAEQIQELSNERQSKFTRPLEKLDRKLNKILDLLEKGGIPPQK